MDFSRNKTNSNIFSQWIDTLDVKYSLNKCILILNNPDKNNTMNDPVAIVSHFISLFILCLVNNNSQLKKCQQIRDPKLIYMENEFYTLIFKIKDIIRNFEENKGEFEKWRTFTDWFEEYLRDNMNIAQQDGKIHYKFMNKYKIKD